MPETITPAPVEIPVCLLEGGSFTAFGNIIDAHLSHMRFINDGTTQLFHNLACI